MNEIHGMYQFELMRQFSIPLATLELCNALFCSKETQNGSTLECKIQALYESAIWWLDGVENLHHYACKHPRIATRDVGHAVLLFPEHQLSSNKIDCLSDSGQQGCSEGSGFASTPRTKGFEAEQCEFGTSDFPSVRELAKFAGLNLAESKTQAQRDQARAERLLTEEVLPILKTLEKDSHHILLPECVMGLISDQKSRALKLQGSIRRLLTFSQLGEAHLNALRVQQKLICQQVAQASNSHFETDLKKWYSVPQASHWRDLLEAGEVYRFSKIERLLTEDGHALYQIGMYPKHTSTGSQPAPVWLHVHMNPSFKPNQRLQIQKVLRKLKEHTSQIACAHLKSDFFKNKGKGWERDSLENGQRDAAVERTSVSNDFVLDVFRGAQQLERVQTRLTRQAA